MSFKFQSEDFEVAGHTVCGHQAIADAANEVLRTHIATLPRVYGCKTTHAHPWCETQYESQTHTAFLWGITEIEKNCEHEPAEMELTQRVVGGIYNLKLGEFDRKDISESTTSVFSNKCKHCGIKLVASWRPA